MKRTEEAGGLYLTTGPLALFLSLSLSFQNLVREAQTSQMENLSIPLWKIWGTSKTHAMETDTGKISSTDSSAQITAHPLGHSAAIPAPTSRPLTGPSPPQAHRASGPILKYQQNQGSWDIRGSLQHRKGETHENTQKNKTERTQRPGKQRRNDQEVRASTPAVPELTKTARKQAEGKHLCVCAHARMRDGVCTSSFLGESAFDRCYRKTSRSCPVTHFLHVCAAFLYDFNVCR